MNECDLFPCQNNGTCINSLGSYTCECETGWQGQDCHIGKSVVLVMLIMQGCYHMQRWYHALFILLLDVDECRSTPCANNGTCINNKGSYTCVCKRGWTDLNCDKGMDCNVETETGQIKENWIPNLKECCMHVIVFIFRC